MDETTPPLPLPRRGIRFILFGREGLRAGWSLLLFVAIAAVLGIALAAMLPHASSTRAAAPGTPLQTIRNEAIGFATIAVASFLVALVERHPFARYGLRRACALPDLLAGMAWGIAMLSLLVSVLALTGSLVVDGIALTGGAALSYGAAWLAAFLLVGLFEEYLTRGFLQYTLARGVAGIVGAVAPHGRHARTIGFWVAAAIFSVGLFAAGHIANPGETAMGLIAVCLAGVTFAYALYRAGSLWWAIGFHATWDWAQSFLYGVRDSGTAVVGHLLASHPAGHALLSGGDTGPEGSVLVVPTLLLTMLLIRFTLPRRATAFDA